MLNNNYLVGLYIRLSREDEDKTHESESISNQKSLLLQYTKENNLKVYDMYIDDGYSGTNFNRPNFNRLIKDIELGKINMVITKDMSRLGRDYIGTGNLIEKYFPEHNVRYIAITDNIDTFLDSSNNDIAPFKAIMNDMYAKDISKKIKSSLKAKQKEGKWVGSKTPFGYIKDPNNKNHLIIEEEQAHIVKRIYNMCLDGLSFYKISKELTNEGIKTPAQYYEYKWRSNYNCKYGMWHSKTIYDILTNRIYTGDTVQNKRTKVNYKIKKIIKNKPSQYIVVENTHEAIIDKEMFYEVQKRIPKNVGRSEKKETHLLDGLLYCGDCGHRISIGSRRKKDNRCYTICNYYRTYIKQKLCTAHSNNYDNLEELILKLLKINCLKYIDSKKIKKDTLNKFKNKENINNQKEIKIIKQSINQLIKNLDTIYLDKINKVINQKQFIRIKDKLEKEIQIKQKKLDTLIKIDIINKNNNSKDKTINEYINDFITMNNISRELIVNLIQKIEIYKDKRINIVLTFSKDYVL